MATRRQHNRVAKPGRKSAGKRSTPPAAFSETQESPEQQAAIANVLRVISIYSPGDVRAAFEVVISSAVQLTNAVCAAIVLFREDRIELAALTDSRGAQFQARWRSAFPLPLDATSTAALKKSASEVMADGVLPPTFTVDARYAVPKRASDEGWAAPIGDRVRAAAPDLVTPPVVRLMVRAGNPMPIGALLVFGRSVAALQVNESALLTTLAGLAEVAFEISRLRKEGGALTDQQTATSKILRVIAESPADVQPVFDSIAATAMRLFEFDVFAVAVTVVREDRIELAAMAADPSMQASWRAFFPLPLDRASITGRTILETTAQSVTDSSETIAPEFERTLGKGVKVRSVVAAPMVREGIGTGAIVLFRATPGKFSDGQITLLSSFASQAVIAIENARLFNETKEALERQTAIGEVLRVIAGTPTDIQPVLDALVARAERLCEGGSATLYLRDGDVLRRAAVHGAFVWPNPNMTLPFDRGSGIGRAVIDGKPVHIRDIKKERAEFPAGWNAVEKYAASVNLPESHTQVSVPLLKDDSAIGAIMVRRTEVRPFTEKQIELLKTFADQAVIAIENVRLFNATREAFEEQEAAAEVLGAISSSIADIKPVVAKILENCVRLFDAKQVAITLVAADGRIHLAGYHGDRREEIERLLSMPPPSYREGSWRYADVFGEAARQAGRPDPRKHWIMHAPMLWEGRGIGAIYVNRESGGEFSEKALRLLKTFADQAVIAIENVRLFKEIQEKSAQLEVANKHKSDFLAHMSHELRTPLNAVIGFSEALMDKMFGDVNEKQLDYLKDIHESGRHLLSLINDILDLSKIEAGRMELEVSRFHMPTALSNAMTLIRERAQRHGIQLGAEIDERVGDFEGDERKFKQIMLNLLSNAVKFTLDGGRVDVRARIDTDKVLISVSDTGIGMAPSDQERLFEEFRQVGGDSGRKAEGTGLGLALTRRLARLHGGDIMVASELGKGSTFTVVLPVRVATAGVGDVSMAATRTA